MAGRARARPERAPVVYFPAEGDVWIRAERRLIEVSPRTRTMYRWVWGHFRQFLGNREPTEEIANQYLSYRAVEVAPRSLGVERAALSYVLNRVLRLNADLLRAKIPDYLPSVPTRAEQRSILAACQDWEQMALISLLLGAGLRIKEAMGICPADLTEDGFVRVIRKGGRERLVPLKPQIIRAVLALRRRRSEPLFAGQYNTVRRKIFDPVIARAGLADHRPRITPHSLRHAAGTAFYRATGDLRLVQEILGHRSISTTVLYVHLAPDELQARLPNILEDLRSQ